MSGTVIEAPARSRAELRRIAELTRLLAAKHLGPIGPRFPVVEMVECVLPMIDPDFCLEVLDVAEMGQDHGLTIPSQHVIQLRQDVYDGAWAGNGRDRGTVAHELGHYILHDDLAYPRRMRESELPAYRSAEWQAKCFAGELLVSARCVRSTMTPQDVASEFGVSHEGAMYQIKKLREEGLI